jgi:serine/threonine protein kinase
MPTGVMLRDKIVAAREETKLALGKVLGNYKLLECIGRGGMGRVYVAEHVRLGRRVALKLLRPEYAIKRESVARFFQEAKAVNKIRHRNIVDITDCVELPSGQTFIIMELLDGLSLGRRYRKHRPLETPQLLAVLVQVCDALEAAHAVGIIHRDLKPDNIFVLNAAAGNGDNSDGDGLPLAKLLDFGIAKLVAEDYDADDTTWRTSANSFLGTPAFMSPEQATGGDLDGRSDVYSMGAIMYELFCGQPLFVGKSFGDFVLQHMHKLPTPPELTPHGSTLAPELIEIILRCLGKKPEDRYPNVTELRDHLLGVVHAIDSELIEELAKVRPSMFLRRTHLPLPSRPSRPVDAPVPAVPPVTPASAVAPIALEVPCASTPPSMAWQLEPMAGSGRRELARSRLGWVMGAVATVALVVLGALRLSARGGASALVPLRTSAVAPLPVQRASEVAVAGTATSAAAPRPGRSAVRTPAPPEAAPAPRPSPRRVVVAEREPAARASASTTRTRPGKRGRPGLAARAELVRAPARAPVVAEDDDVPAPAPPPPRPPPPGAIGRETMNPFGGHK